jgi:hypothetical protein
MVRAQGERAKSEEPSLPDGGEVGNPVGFLLCVNPEDSLYKGGVSGISMGPITLSHSNVLGRSPPLSRVVSVRQRSTRLNPQSNHFQPKAFPI